MDNNDINVTQSLLSTVTRIGRLTDVTKQAMDPSSPGGTNFSKQEKDKIYNLANEGFNIFASVNPRVAGGFEHQGYFALIDKNGFIRCRSDQFGNPIVYYMGIDEQDVEIQEVDLLIDDIEKLLKE